MATIEKRGKTWRAKIRRRGFPAISRTFDTRSQAQQWARREETRIDRDEWDDPGEARTTTLREALERYLREVTPRKRGARQETLRIQAWMRHPLADRPLSRIRSADLAEYRDARLEDGVSGQTVRNDLIPISHLFNTARREWGMTGLRNPVEDVAKPAPSRARDRRLRPGEEEALLAAAPTTEWRALITLALETAARRSELLRLTWDRIDTKARVAHLTDTKNGEDRRVPLSPRALEALQELRAGPRQIDGRLFDLSLDDHSNRWRALRKRAGIEDVRFHDLRHEGTSRLVECGLFNSAEVAAITGHKTMVMLRRYYHADAALLADRMGKAGKG
ncbi:MULTISPECIES: integrase [unclassified Thioalkalivibrio]|uniref:integrase n=1 Tax=unclassified Thioalkalivibrio TaxID=2621013 RepID=UPI00037915B4|nr:MULTISPECIES: tyrosine-type recombinase/integrase [unclassified Thioalkalivibrio]